MNLNFSIFSLLILVCSFTLRKYLGEGYENKFRGENRADCVFLLIWLKKNKKRYIRRILRKQFVRQIFEVQFYFVFILISRFTFLYFLLRSHSKHSSAFLTCIEVFVKFQKIKRKQNISHSISYILFCLQQKVVKYPSKTRNLQH